MIEIRPATENDIELISRLAKVIFPCTYKNIITQEQIDYMFEMMYAPHNISKQMSQGHLYNIALLDDKPCGYLAIRELGEGHYYIEKIYTLPSIHGQGVGKALFEYGSSLALQLSGADEVLLELNVNRFNTRAIKFYTKMGMRIDHQTDNCVGNNFYANDYVMAINPHR